MTNIVFLMSTPKICPRGVVFGFEICGLANNGQGMADKEMLVSLKTCLSGSRKKIYENVVKANKSIALDDDGPEKIYHKIRARLFRFLETDTEKQLRIKDEWKKLEKNKGMTAPTFNPGGQIGKLN